jgi:hypothetical protein
VLLIYSGTVRVYALTPQVPPYPEYA